MNITASSAKNRQVEYGQSRRGEAYEKRYVELGECPEKPGAFIKRNKQDCKSSVITTRLAGDEAGTDYRALDRCLLGVDNRNQQLCRWLLLSLDRLPGDRLCMTQELIANMLGVRREGVTDAAGKLQRLGVIEYNRGQIKVLHRARLELLSCECYAVVKKETERLLPYMPVP